MSEKLTIVEPLEFGMNLLSNGNVIKKDGTVISQEEYAQMQQSMLKNKLDWKEIDQDEFFNLIENAIFATKTYETEENIGGITQSRMGFACLDNDGNPFYLRSNEFSGSEKFEFTEVHYSQMIYNVDKNASEEAFDIMVEKLEEFFGTTNQVGTEFSPDNDTMYKMKKFLKDGHVWSIVFTDGKLTNIKQGEKMRMSADVSPRASKVSEAINSNRFANLV